MHLKHGTVLQGGKYRIEQLLGQGGFGITYLAVQTGLNRKVAIKEFFMKEHCNRDADTSLVSVPSLGSRELVAKFREKFIREAQMIAGYKHPNIVIIYDVFEDNGTAYYVMEYHDGGSLGSLSLPLSSEEAACYIRQVASALSYLHERNTMHLDVKPSNVLIDKEGNAVLIDFGVSKRYDLAGHQTSSTPVGISHGYAPGEQYQQSTLAFSPATDIYSLGATFYKLVTGDTPPDQNEVIENGLPPFPSTVPASIASLIGKSMQPRRKDRPQSISEFLGLLDGTAAAASSDLDTIVAVPAMPPIPPVPVRPPVPPVPVRPVIPPVPAKPSIPPVPQTPSMPPVPQTPSIPPVPQTPSTPAVPVKQDGTSTELFSDDKGKSDSLASDPVAKKKSNKLLLWIFASVILIALGVLAFNVSSGEDLAKEKGNQIETPASTEPAKLKQDVKSYSILMEKGAEYEDDELFSSALQYYKAALEIEREWGSVYPDKFRKNAGGAVKRVEALLDEIEAEQNETKQNDAELKRQQEFEKDLEDYNSKLSQAGGKSRTHETSLKEAKILYEEAAKYEEKYKGTSNASYFAKGAAELAVGVQGLIDDKFKGSHIAHSWVDLGLSVKWATCNVGASKPEDYGNYYAWGEIRAKSSYTSDNSSSYGKSWTDIAGNSSHDAARANWGGSWRLPTKAELQELIDNCTWAWATQNGHNGYKVTSKKNGQSIFLPAAGYRYGDALYYEGEIGRYWSSIPDESYTGLAKFLYFGDDDHGVDWGRLSYGLSVRPVLDD